MMGDHRNPMTILHYKFRGVLCRSIAIITAYITGNRTQRQRPEIFEFEYVLKRKPRTTPGRAEYPC